MVLRHSPSTLSLLAPARVVPVESAQPSPASPHFPSGCARCSPFYFSPFPGSAVLSHRADMCDNCSLLCRFIRSCYGSLSREGGRCWEVRVHADVKNEDFGFSGVAIDEKNLPHTMIFRKEK